MYGGGLLIRYSKYCILEKIYDVLKYMVHLCIVCVFCHFSKTVKWDCMIITLADCILLFEFGRFTKVENGNLCLTKYVISSLQILLEKSVISEQKAVFDKECRYKSKVGLKLIRLENVSSYLMTLLENTQQNCNISNIADALNNNVNSFESIKYVILVC